MLGAQGGVGWCGWNKVMGGMSEIEVEVIVFSFECLVFSSGPPVLGPRSSTRGSSLRFEGILVFSCKY